MDKQEKQGMRHNAELVDALFGMMFETVWASPGSRMRNAAAFRRFEQCARQTVVLLTTTDLATADSTRLEQVANAARDLAAGIDELAHGGLIVPTRYEEISALMARIERSVANAADVAVMLRAPRGSE